MELKTFVKNYETTVPKSRVWQALVDPALIEQWGGGPDAVMSEKVGASFKLWDGSIWGKNIEVQPEKKLVQEWYGGEWAKPSIVTFELSEVEGKTLVKLTHQDVPDNEADSFDGGWDDFYMGPLLDSIQD